MENTITPPGQPTAFLQRLRAGEFVTTVEVHPPRGFRLDKTLERLQALLRRVRVDAFNATDVPLAQARMSAVALSELLQRHTGVEAILHVATRNRNILSVHSDLIGAHALNIRNAFVFWGDDPNIGDYPNASSISDVTSSELVGMLNGMNAGEEVAGHALTEPTSFAIGCAVQPGSQNMDEELASLDRKVRAGAHFIMTQSVFDAAPVRRLHDRLGGFPIPLVLGILPLYSARHAEFLHANVPGMVIPDSTRERLRDAGEGAQREGVAIARKLLDEVRDIISGVYLVPSFGRFDLAGDVLVNDPSEGAPLRG